VISIMISKGLRRLVQKLGCISHKTNYLSSFCSLVYALKFFSTFFAPPGIKILRGLFDLAIDIMGVSFLLRNKTITPSTLRTTTYRNTSTNFSQFGKSSSRHHQLGIRRVTATSRWLNTLGSRYLSLRSLGKKAFVSGFEIHVFQSFRF